MVEQATDIMRLARAIREAEAFVAFTGAGVSTASGIPDFRSPGGIWNRYQPIDYQAFLTSEAARREYWRRGKNTYAVIRAARPNAAHYALAEFEHLGYLKLLITQNIDGLHTVAGSSPERTVELHGTAHRVYCLSCGAETSRVAIVARLEAGEAIPPCRECGGLLRAATVAFGEPLPSAEWARALAAARTCDLMLVVGSSLVVNPAARLPRLAAAAGAAIAIVNQSPTPLDRGADLVLRGDAAAILSQLLTAVRGAG